MSVIVHGCLDHVMFYNVLPRVPLHSTLYLASSKLYSVCLDLIKEKVYVSLKIFQLQSTELCTTEYIQLRGLLTKVCVHEHKMCMEGEHLQRKL